MSVMDSFNVQNIWKAIQESERSDENLYPNTTLSDRFFEERHSEPERSDGEEHTLTAGAIPQGASHGSPLGQNQMLLRRPEGRLINGLCQSKSICSFQSQGR
jgi:hypothetical protein